MNRNDFLKKLGFGALAVAIAPTVIANNETTEEKPMGWYSRTFPSFRDPQTGHNIYVDKGFEADYYCLGDVFSRNGADYLCVKKVKEDDGYWEIVLRPFDPKHGEDIIVKATKDLSQYYHHRESVLLKFND